jgi:hypothetical protein
VKSLNDLVIAFDYSVLDTDTADYLKQKEINIRGIASKAFGDLGKELKEVQDRLAQHRYGCFEEWYTGFGLKKQTVYNYINYHNLIVQQLDNKELIEALPRSLAYEIAKSSAHQDLKQKVLSGDITTTKEYQKLLKEQKDEIQLLTEDNATLRQANKELEKTKPGVIERQVEVIPPDVKQKLLEVKTLERQYNELSIENKRLKFEVEANKNPVDGHLEMEAKVSTFTGRVKNFLRDMAPLGYLGQEVLKSSPGAQKEYESAIMALEKWCSDMRDVMVKPTKEKIIEVEVL